MKRWFLTVTLLCCATPFVMAQDAAKQDNNEPSTTNKPAGTRVVGHDRDTLVSPQTKPVKLDAKVIEAAQHELRSRGYEPGSADGVAGPQTRAAVQKFQADQGLSPTGALDEDTLAKLNVGGANIVRSAPADLGRGGKAFGHNIREGHPVDAGKAMAQGSESFGKKVAKGSKSLAVRGVEKVGEGLSSVGGKVEGKAQGRNNSSASSSQQQPSSNTPQ